MNHKISIETARLILRNVEAEDRDFLLSLWTNPAVTEYMGGPRNLAALEKGIDESIEAPFAEEWDLWILTDKQKHRLGHCGLLEKEVEGAREIEVVYVISDSFWGQGFASEIAGALVDYAFHEKKLQSVIALIKPSNRQSEKVAVKAGLSLDREIIRQEDTRMLLYRRENI